MRRLAPALVAAALALAGCADGAATPTNLGVAGASCVKSPDCEPPLQCFDGVCALEPGGGQGAVRFDGAEPDAAADPGAALVDAAVGPDVPHVTDIQEWIDLGEHDIHPDPDSLVGATPFDTSQTEIFDDCEALGIDDTWVGTFVGEIAFDLDTDGLVYPEAGIISVVGELSFEITCIDSKLVVVGLMAGSGSVVGRTELGDFPYEVAIQGFYSPASETLDTELVDGVVTIYGLLQVYFEGSLTGELTNDGRFDGTWDGEATGTNVDDVITGTAAGSGTWLAIGG